jgi:hypothetical protein
MRKQDRITATQFTTLKIIATALDRISIGEFSQFAVTGV